MRSRKPLLAFALTTMVIAVPALAQQPSQYPPPCDASKVSKSDVDRAHTVFLSGKGFLDESNYDKAISYFKDAYSIDCSVHAILPIIATAYERKGDKLAAVQALQEYLKRVPNAPDREVIERRIRNLQEQSGQAAPTAIPPATTTTPIPPLPPGSSSGAAAPTAAPTESAPAAPTSTATPAPETGGAHTIGPWILVGVGGAGLVAGVVLYAVGAGDVSSAENQCPTRTGCAQSVADQGNNGRSLETVGGVVGGLGAAAVVGGLLWHFLERPAGPATTGAAVTPVAGPGFAGLTAGGRF